MNISGSITTGFRLNFAQSDPPALYRPLDITVPVGLLFASLIVATMGDAGIVFLFAVPLAVLYVPVLMTVRRLLNQATRQRADSILDEIERDRVR